ncbi:MAG TPA: mannose-6-phosphate isomerase, partial [Verrucomicrobiota bacterium]|nr:mannose-6-phosphate isomerase [Verrucomicrobiota bacterium]
WEVTDRTEGVSRVAGGPLAGATLGELMARHGGELLGDAAPTAEGRFPLLVKILDAQDVLSLQVHPPAHLAAQLGGEPKTELWYVAQAAPGAHLYAGLRRGVTREEFARRAQDGSVAECFHRLAVRAGDAMFLR